MGTYSGMVVADAQVKKGLNGVIGTFLFHRVKNAKILDLYV